ncbi:MAG: RluA family pseudouridine synthase [Actinomycetota bacterium]|nr:RluA family pseudouridine synthase [Actinomycetota bacterium]
MSDKKREVYKVVVKASDVGQRLDAFLAKRRKIPSRSFAQNLISQGLVQVNGKIMTKHHRLKKGETISLTIPSPEEPKILPELIPLNIIYEDEDIIVLSKPAGMVVHPAYGHTTGTLVNALLAHTKDLSGIGGVKRPGIVHRLDKDTSGLMVVAKNDKAHLSLAKQVKKRKLRRIYLALVHGTFDIDSGTIEAPIGRSPHLRKKMMVISAGRHAVTNFKVKERFKDYTLLEVDIQTGRTHQIRVHMSYIKHPVVGDPEYGYRKAGKELGLNRQFLHAHRLQFTHPGTEKSISFEDKLPEDLNKVLTLLRSGDHL